MCHTFCFISIFGYFDFYFSISFSVFSIFCFVISYSLLYQTSIVQFPLLYPLSSHPTVSYRHLRWLSFSSCYHGNQKQPCFSLPGERTEQVSFPIINFNIPNYRKKAFIFHQIDLVSHSVFIFIFSQNRLVFIWHISGLVNIFPTPLKTS